MNAIYAKQVKDILDYDNNINKQLVRVEKKHIKRWDDGAPDLMPYMQIENDAVDAAKQLSSDLKILLERKITAMVIFDPRKALASGPPTSEDQKYFGEVVSIEEVFRQYNLLAKLYLNPSNTIQTKLSIKTEASRLDGLVARVHGQVQEVIREIIAHHPSGVTGEAQRIVMVYNLYDIIYDQLQKGNLYPITDDDLLSNRRNIIKKNPALSRIIPPGVPVFNMGGDDDDDDDDDDDQGGSE